jgi:hypothetical protein
MRSCICMNCAFTPRIVPAVASMTMVQMLSWRSGQKYFSRTITAEPTTVPEWPARAIVVVDEAG